jgi:hypothetical protein
MKTGLYKSSTLIVNADIVLRNMIRYDALWRHLENFNATSRAFFKQIYPLYRVYTALE